MMNFQVKPSQYQRRKTDIEAWEKTIDGIAMELCPETEVQAGEWRQKQLSKRSNAHAQVLLFPVWRKYRPDAIKVAHVQRAVPLLKHLPLQVSRFIGDVVFK